MLAFGSAGERYGRLIHVLHLADGELDDVLRSPFAVTELSQPDDVVVVVTEPDGSTATRLALDRVVSLPCVVVGRGHDEFSDLTDVECDSSIVSEERLLTAIESNPTAAVTLALLLRSAERRSLGEGLIAESAAYSVLQSGPEFGPWHASRPIRSHPAQSGPPVCVERDGHRLEITLNRPHVRNALDRNIRDALLEALAVPAADDTVTEIDIRGRGAAFCSGGDLDEFGSFGDPATAHLVRTAASVGRAIAAVADRTIVHLHGACAGSGVELAGFARAVSATPDTTLSLPELALGLIPGAGGTVSLVRRAGRHRVALLALSGVAIPAETGRAWGLVDAVE